MKKSWRPKKLELAKETVRCLTEDQVQAAQGGAAESRFCPTYTSYTCGFSCDNSFNVCCA